VYGIYLVNQQDIVVYVLPAVAGLASGAGIIDWRVSIAFVFGVMVTTMNAWSLVAFVVGDIVGEVLRKK